MHTNSLAMAGDYRDLGFLGKGPMVDGLAVSAGKRQTEVVATQPHQAHKKVEYHQSKKRDISNELSKGTFLTSFDKL